MLTTYWHKITGIKQATPVPSAVQWLTKKGQTTGCSQSFETVASVTEGRSIKTKACIL